MKQTAVTIGKFDGFHRGHQILLNDVREAGRVNGYDKLCLKLDFHDVGIFSCSENEAFLKNCYDIDRLEYLEFTPEFAAMSPDEFAGKILAGCYNVKYVAVGKDFRFGKDRVGDVETLSELGNKYGFTVKVEDKLFIDDEAVSSSRIRDLMEEGNMRKVSEMLGRSYFISGTVEHGKKLGRTLGYPTINLKAEEGKLLPRFGVYSTDVCIFDDDRVYSGITNIGIRPSVNDGNTPTIETFIYDFNENIYGAELEIRLRDFIRPEMRFDDFDALTKQIEIDIETAAKLSADRHQ